MEEQCKYKILKVSDRSVFVIGKVLEENDKEVKLHFPIIMSLSVNEADQIEVTSSKWFPFVEDDVVCVQRSNIIAMADPKPNAVEHYLKFIKDNPEIQDDSLENVVLGAQMQKETEWFASSSIH